MPAIPVPSNSKLPTISRHTRSKSSAISSGVPPSVARSSAIPARPSSAGRPASRDRPRGPDLTPQHLFHRAATASLTSWRASAQKQLAARTADLREQETRVRALERRAAQAASADRFRTTSITELQVLEAQLSVDTRGLVARFEAWLERVQSGPSIVDGQVQLVGSVDATWWPECEELLPRAGGDEVEELRLMMAIVEREGRREKAWVREMVDGGEEGRAGGIWRR